MTLVRPDLTPEEYLALERQAQHKSEYVNGRIYAMTGASRAHNLIVGNLVRELGTQLRGRPCETYASDMRVKVNQTGLYTYPDVVVVCGEPHFEDAQVDTLLNPTAIIEVLSESTESYDRGEKFAHYRRLQSLQEYVLIAQDKVRAECYVREGDRWILSEVAELDETLVLTSVGCTLRLRDVYERVDLGNPDARAPRTA
jgi:Uma2 family endonuclease